MVIELKTTKNVRVVVLEDEAVQLMGDVMDFEGFSVDVEGVNVLRGVMSSGVLSIMTPDGHGLSHVMTDPDTIGT